MKLSEYTDEEIHAEIQRRNKNNLEEDLAETFKKAFHMCGSYKILAKSISNGIPEHHLKTLIECLRFSKTKDFYDCGSPQCVELKEYKRRVVCDVELH